MICPYAVNITRVTKTRYEYDTDGRNTESTSTVSEITNYIECPQEGCGAWKNSRCNYNGGSAEDA